MVEKNYKKTYKPLVAWIVLFMLFTMLMPFGLEFIGVSEDNMTKVLLLVIVASIDLLMYIVYKGEYVYWINGGPSYEQAKKAGSKKRKAYAGDHLKIFSKVTGICGIYMLISFICHLSIGIDITICLGGIIVAALMTIKIKF